MKKLVKNLMKVPIVGQAVKQVASHKAQNEADSISAHFVQFLSPEMAWTQELQKEVFKIRHDVYCRELSFEDVNEKHLERDAFDDHSSFCMIKHIRTQDYTGCIRLVESPSADKKLPIEAYCSSAISNSDIHPNDFDRSEICEISRLAVRDKFRKRQTDKHKGAAVGVINEDTYSEIEFRCFPFIAIGLYMCAAAMAVEKRIPHVFVMMEPRLARSMKFVGIDFKKIGDTIEYHGKRAPYYINSYTFEENLKPGYQKLFRVIDDSLKKQIEAEVN